MPMRNLWAPKHRARVFRLETTGAYVERSVSETLDGELQPASVRAQMQDGLVIESATGTWYMADSEVDTIKLGDRLLVDGNYWQVVTEPSKRNAQPYLGYASCGVEKVRK